MSHQTITYFGYGSLVNRATRPVGESFSKATLRGWRRAWAHRVSNDETTDRGRCCSLSIEPVAEESSAALPGSCIDGVLVTIALSDLAALDEREKGYNRLHLPASDFILPSSVHVDEVVVYVSDEQHQGDANTDYPVLQSYIDVVLSGYSEVFGEDGLQRLMDSTRGWELPIDNDRDKPRYPRAVALKPSELLSLDALVNDRRMCDDTRT